MLPLPSESDHSLPTSARPKKFFLLAALILSPGVVAALLLGTQVFEASILSGSELLKEQISVHQQLLVQEKNQIVLKVPGILEEPIALSDLGLEVKPSRNPILSPQRLFKAAADLDNPIIDADLRLDRSQWEQFVTELKTKVSKSPQQAQVFWDQGWQFNAAENGRVLSERNITSALTRLVSSIEQRQEDLALKVRTTSIPPQDDGKKELFQSIQSTVRDPILVSYEGGEKVLDLNSDPNFLYLSETRFELNRDTLQAWASDLAKSLYREPSMVTITGNEEIRPGVFRALTEGEFKEGQKVDEERLVNDILAALETNPTQSDRAIRLELQEIPVRVFSQAENLEYDLISVGYSEYSTGNDRKRVHNVTTGINRLNSLLVKSDQKLSFNKLVGPINNDFVDGYGIFGTLAKPILGGGICQVSTTFYRGILNLGVPVKQRQNHSWDLSYYQSGGYGLDATIFPGVLDVLAENDLKSDVFIRSYVRPDTEEAFILFYGKSDGRQVVLKPREDYKPKRGPKTLIWDQTVVYEDGSEDVRKIVSKYNK
ncbi:MAG: VanW family protein [bacterium]|nr:VanW family protein [bacterium]